MLFVRQFDSDVQGEKVDPRDTIIAVDLHGVLFKHDYKNMFRTFFKSKHKPKLFFALLSPLLWIDVVKLIFRNSVAEEYFIGLARKHRRLKPFITLGIAIANQQRPAEEVVSLCNDLKTKGYTLHLFSNIGSIVFDDLQRKFSDIFQLFDCLCIPSEENDYRRKPSKRAFKAYLDLYNPREKQVILIDDKKVNVRAAREYGLHSIFFRFPAQLKRELHQMGLEW